MTDMIWRWSDLVAASAGQATGRSVPKADASITGISIDSRTIRPGEIFVAIKGDRFDGHDFVEKALANGALAAIVATNFQLDSGGQDGTLLHVPDTLNALRKIAIAARQRSTAHIIAVTGSVGKTGTKEALKACLSQFGPTHAADKSFNNHWGVPLTLARLPQSSEFGVFEIGMNHAGEITPLARLVRPQIVIITAIEPVHLGQFHSVDEIAEAKAEIFDGLEPGGTAILNRDSPYYALLRDRALARGAGQIIGFGVHDDADARIVAVELGSEGSRVTMDMRGEPVEFQLAAPGRHLVQNAASVIAAIHALGADINQAARALTAVTPTPGRGARTAIPRQGGDILLIDESYNANPASMAAALNAMALLPRSKYPRRVVVLGDMLELGERSGALHADLSQKITAAGIDKVLTCGTDMALLYERLTTAQQGTHAPDAERLCPHLLSMVQPGDAVMIKGSLGSRMGPLVAAFKSALCHEA